MLHWFPFFSLQKTPHSQCATYAYTIQWILNLNSSSKFKSVHKTVVVVVVVVIVIFNHSLTAKTVIEALNEIVIIYFLFRISFIRPIHILLFDSAVGFVCCFFTIPVKTTAQKNTYKHTSNAYNVYFNIQFSVKPNHSMNIHAELDNHDQLALSIITKYFIGSISIFCCYICLLILWFFFSFFFQTDFD